VNSECDGRFCLYIQAYDAGARGYNVICVLVSGAAQLVNKLNGEDFNEADEQLFEVRTWLASSCCANIRSCETWTINSVVDLGFAKGEGGANHGERAEREPKRGSGGGAPSGVQGSGGEAFLKLKAFLYIFTQKVAKS